MKKGPWYVSILSLAIIFTAAFAVSAVDPSIWITPGSGTKTIIQNNINEYSGDKFCTVHTEYEVEYSTVLGSRKFSKLIPIDACWYTTSYGLIGYNAPYSRVYVKVSNQSNAVVRLTDNTYGLSLGQTNAMAYTYYMNSYSRMLYIYENITSRLSLNRSGAYDQYTLDRSTNQWKLQYSDGSLVGVNKVFSSQNGEWLVVEGGAGFLRINVKTKDVLTFEPAMYGYGYGSDPSHDLAISDDGRYAIVSGGPVNIKVAYIYDLSTCVPNANKYIPATGCGKRNFKADYFSTMPTNRAPSTFLFSSDNEWITANALNSSGTVDKYVITAPGKNEHYLEYLAAGDSYSSGEGDASRPTYYLAGTDGDGESLVDWDTGISNYPYTVEKCHISKRSYPYLIAQATYLSIQQHRSIACSGSTINDVINIDPTYTGRFQQYKNLMTSLTEIDNSKISAVSSFTPGRESQVRFIEKYKPRVITIGIGGNDIKFSDKLVSCLMPGTCSYENDLRYSLGLEIQNLHSELMKLYKKLGEAGPTTRFYVVGYPQIVSTNEACKINVRLNFEERVMARNVISYLNEVIKSAAEYSGFTYLDIENSLTGKQLCDESSGELAVQALVGGDDKQIVYEIGGVRFYIEAGNESFHPNHIGHERMASAIKSQLSGESILSYRKCPLIDGLRCPTGTGIPPLIPSYFIEKALPGTEKVIPIKAVDTTLQVNNITGVQQGGIIQMQHPLTDSQEVLRLAPSQTASVTMYSSPQNVGTMIVDVNGNASGAITIPAGAEPGYHTIVINLKDSLFRNTTLYQQIYVYNALEDFDGDGIANTDEKCGIVNPANVDEDRDGIDDACDGIISIAPDTNAPTISAQLTSQPNQNGWYNNDVTVSWTVSDDVDTDLVAPTEVVANKEGEHTYESAEVCDKAGNCAKGSMTIRLDKTKPIVTGQTTGEPNLNGWFNTNTIINWAATDNIATVSNPQNKTAYIEGEHAYTSDEVCDNADNCATGTLTLRIDKSAPTILPIVFTKNPKAVIEASQLSTSAAESESYITEAEYFIGDDPGRGHGATMTVNDKAVSTTFGTDFGTGVYKISARVKDAADNWSNVESDYLVVYDATSGVRLRGSRMVEINSSNNQLPWVGGSNSIQGKFAFSVRYGSDGKVTPQSDFQFAYKLGTNCIKLPHNCHSFELNATSINWLTTTGSNQEVGIFYGIGTLKSDDQSQPVSFTVFAQDGERLSPVANDTFSMSLYPESGSFGTSSLYFVAPTEVGRGNIKIKF